MTFIAIGIRFVYRTLFDQVKTKRSIQSFEKCFFVYLVNPTKRARAITHGSGKILFEAN